MDATILEAEAKNKADQVDASKEDLAVDKNEVVGMSSATTAKTEAIKATTTV